MEVVELAYFLIGLIILRECYFLSYVVGRRPGDDRRERKEKEVKRQKHLKVLHVVFSIVIISQLILWLTSVDSSADKQGLVLIAVGSVVAIVLYLIFFFVRKTSGKSDKTLGGSYRPKTLLTDVFL